MAHEKRRRTRVCAQFDAYAYLEGERIPLSTQNISLKGALFGPEPRLLAGHECTLIFTLSKDVNVRIKARIVRSDAEGSAVDFESMDEAAFFHLHNMVCYSSANADRIDQELQVPAFQLPDDGETD